MVVHVSSLPVDIEYLLYSTKLVQRSVGVLLQDILVIIWLSERKLVDSMAGIKSSQQPFSHQHCYQLKTPLSAEPNNTGNLINQKKSFNSASQSLS